MRPAAEGVEAAVAAFERDLAARDKGVTGIIRLTCGSGVAACLRLMPLIDAFHARRPGLQIELVITDRILDLSKGEADLALRVVIREGEPEDQALCPNASSRMCPGQAMPTVAISSDTAGRIGPRQPQGPPRQRLRRPDRGYPGARWHCSVAHHATIATRCDHWQALILAVTTGAGLRRCRTFKGKTRRILVRVINDIGMELPCYRLMNSHMQHISRLRAFADFMHVQESCHSQRSCRCATPGQAPRCLRAARQGSFYLGFFIRYFPSWERFCPRETVLQSGHISSILFPVREACGRACRAP